MTRIERLLNDRSQVQKEREKYLYKLKIITGFDHKLMVIPDYLASDEKKNEDNVPFERDINEDIHNENRINIISFNHNQIRPMINNTNPNQIILNTNHSKIIPNNQKQIEEDLDELYYPPNEIIEQKNNNENEVYVYENYVDKERMNAIN